MTAGPVLVDLSSYAPELPKAEAGPGTKGPGPAERMLTYCQAEIQELWHDQDANAYATLQRGEQVEHLSLCGKRFPLWMREIYFRQEAKPPKGQALKDALGTLEALAVLQGRQYQVHLRVARSPKLDRIYVDLGSNSQEVVEVGPEGWTIRSLEDIPVRFYRTPGMKGLPRPVQPGRVEALRPLLNADDRGFLLSVAWLLASLSGSGPYPILALSGEQGSAKSSMSRLLQGLVDPSTAGVRAAIRDGEDLYVAARNSHVLCLDNLSTLRDQLADDLCRISTGASFSKRKLFRDDEEAVIYVCRPLIINGIPDLLSRGDLADRCLGLTLRAIPGSARVAELDYWAKVEAVSGEILGGLLTALSGALARWGQTRLAELPRMADFVRLVVAAEPDLPWPVGAFLEVYQQVRQEAASISLDGDPFAEALQRVLKEQNSWEGSATALFGLLSQYRDGLSFSEGWPKNPKAASDYLRRLAPALRLEGIRMSQERQPGGNRNRIIRLERLA